MKTTKASHGLHSRPAFERGLPIYEIRVHISARRRPIPISSEVTSSLTGRALIDLLSYYHLLSIDFVP